MALIKVIKDKLGNIIYPLTKEKAVYSDIDERLDNKLSNLHIGDDGKPAFDNLTVGNRLDGSDIGLNSSSFGIDNTASGNYSHAEGYHTTASGQYSHAEGYISTVSGSQSHSEGYRTLASGNSAHAEGFTSEARGDGSHVENSRNLASGINSHAEGDTTIASGANSHAEGYHTTASGANSHVEGDSSIANGYASHADGTGCTAAGSNSSAHGLYTVANGDQQAVFGRYNVADASSSLLIIGNGTSDVARSNALRVDTNGHIYGGISSVNISMASGFTMAEMCATDRTGRQVVLQIYASGSIPANTWVTVGTIPNAVDRPFRTIRATCVGDSVIGRLVIQTNGVITALFNVAQTSICGSVSFLSNV